MSTHLTIKNENRPTPRTVRKKGLLPLNKKMNFALLTLHPCLLLCFLILNMQPIFMRLHPSLPKTHFISSIFLIDL